MENKNLTHDNCRTLVKDTLVSTKCSFRNPKTWSKTKWLMVAATYIALFWDFSLGLFTIILATTYLLVKRFAPAKLEQAYTYCRNKLQPVTSRPRVKRGLIAIFCGLLILRIFGGWFGFIVIVLSTIYLVLSKYASTVCEMVDSYVRIALDWMFSKVETLWGIKKYRVAAITLIVAILLISPFTMSMENMSVMSVTPIGTEIQSYHVEKEIERLSGGDEPKSEIDLLRSEYLKLSNQAQKLYMQAMRSMDFQERQSLLQEYRLYERQAEATRNELLRNGVIVP